ncbi:hypothetical protein BDV23DRAFT_164905 [Aspergillus alliaceus]|uniref:DUF7726 domain-containing protein n=1 Tax=Petromyces alliaceus TaxID=209559 RepID=A0A5N7BV14_PETAA|nr:hypothetical protein BDV23DRAFT_164905 [Aspergillus alliaceus]
MPRAKNSDARAPLNPIPANGGVLYPPSRKTDTPEVRSGDENTNPIILSPGKPSKHTPSSTTKSSAAGKKRKADDTPEPEEIDDDDPRLDVYQWDCNQIRRKIKNLIESKEMKIGEFQRVLDVSARSYSAFLKMSGPMKGSESNTYVHAHRFFRKRELQGIKEPRKKPVSKQAKLDTEKKYDVSEIHLPGEEEVEVEVYDTCDVVRKKIRAHLREPNVTQASFLREIAKTYPPQMKKKFQNSSLTRFLDLSGPNAGNTNGVFYAAYVFFEKLRIRDGRPKTEFREDMERIWGPEGGFDITSSANRAYICHTSQYVYVDEYGWPRCGTL